VPQDEGRIQIDQPIVGYSVVQDGEEAPASLIPPEVRPEVLEGRTYKIHPPTEAHALYITINDVVLDAGTPNEHRRPFEIFLNSKDMESFQWIVALTRVLSGIFRKGGNLDFLVEELRSVFHPNGGYWMPGGKWQPSVVAHIGDVLQRHLYEQGLVDRPPDPGKAAQAQAQAQAQAAQEEPAPDSGHSGSMTRYCADCARYTPHRMVDNCPMCEECGGSKCG